LWTKWTESPLATPRGGNSRSAAAADTAAQGVDGTKERVWDRWMMSSPRSNPPTQSPAQAPTTPTPEILRLSLNLAAAGLSGGRQGALVHDPLCRQGSPRVAAARRMLLHGPHEAPADSKYDSWINGYAKDQKVKATAPLQDSQLSSTDCSRSLHSCADELRLPPELALEFQKIENELRALSVDVGLAHQEHGSCLRESAHAAALLCKSKTELDSLRKQCEELACALQRVTLSLRSPKP